MIVVTGLHLTEEGEGGAQYRIGTYRNIMLQRRLHPMITSVSFWKRAVCGGRRWTAVSQQGVRFGSWFKLQGYAEALECLGYDAGPTAVRAWLGKYRLGDGVIDRCASL